MWLNPVVIVCIVPVIVEFGSVIAAEEVKTGEEVSIEKFTNRHNGDNYLFSYSLSDGQFRYERGRFKTFLDESKVPVWFVTGTFGYKLRDGKLISYKYIADENGYRQHTLSEDEDIDDVGSLGNRIDPKTLASLVG